MSILINQDLQISHKIVSLLEVAKANAEGILDDFPDLFCIIDERGTIFKGNHMAARLFNVDSVQDVLGRNVSELFLKETFNIFDSHLRKIRQEKGGGKVEFELLINNNGGSNGNEEEKTFFWSVNQLQGTAPNRPRLYCVVGRDISGLRAFEKKISEVFLNLPFGLFTLNGQGEIVEPYSAYVPWLLGRQDILGQKLEDLLFKPVWDRLTQQEKEGTKNLLGFFDIEVAAFDILESTFPKRVHYQLPEGHEDGHRWIALKYQAVAYGGQVKGLMILVEDKTSQMATEEEEIKKKLCEDKQLTRIMEIRNSDQEMLPDILQEVSTLFKSCEDCLQKGDWKGLANSLHGIKGNCRLADFKYLKNESHSLESMVLEQIKEGGEGMRMEMEIPVIQEKFADMKAEWDEVHVLAKVFSLAKQNPSSLPSRKSLKDMESVLRRKCETTAAALQKVVKVYFDFPSLGLDQGVLEKLNTILLHLTTNAIDHGLESPEEREKLGKDIHGNILISAEARQDAVYFEFKDDGRGIDAKKVIASALKKGIVTVEEIKRMDMRGARQLIFKSGLSSAEKVTEFSGRGLGLDAVAQIVKELGGDIRVDARKGGGSVFYFHIQVPVQGTF